MSTEGKGAAHGVDRSLVCGLLVPPALQRRSRESGVLGHPKQLKGQVPIHVLTRHVPN